MNPVQLKRTVWLLLRCTPLAILWAACWVTIYPLARWRSRRQLPGIVEALGLMFSSSRDAVEGAIEGYQVHVVPESGELAIELNHWKNVEINDQKPYHDCREDLCEITTAPSTFNTIFRTRRAYPSDVPLFRGDTPLLQALEQFYIKWLWRIQLFRIDDHGLTMQLNCGQPISAYIPASMLEPLLRELCMLARMIEEKLTNKPEM